MFPSRELQERRPQPASELIADTAVPADVQACCMPTSLHADIRAILTRGGDLQDALQSCAQAIVLHADAALVRIWVLQGGVLTLQASAGRVVRPDDARVRVPVGQFSVGHIARTRQALLTNSILDHAHIHDKEWSRREGMTAFAGCPLLVDGELEGVIAMFDKKPIAPEIYDALTGLSRELAKAIKRHSVNDQGDAHAVPPEPFPSAEHAVIVAKLDGTITDWNSGAEKFFGYRRDEAVGHPLDIVVPAERAGEHRAIMDEVALGGHISRPETIRLHKSGRQINVCLTMTALRDAAGIPIGVVAVAHDLADFKTLEQKYCVAQKMEAFGQLAGGVAHDFNNLITIILGYSEIAISRLTPDDSRRELLAEVHKAGERAESLTRQLLAFSRMRSVEPKVLDLNAVVGDTEKMLRRLIGEDILMSTNFAPSLKPIKIDPGQLQQVILNLAVNARDAMPRGGRLTIETANVVLDHDYARANPHVQPGNYVLFTITDTGIGISPLIRPRIFEPLFTTKAPGRGTGLGLTTVQTIVKQYGGHITVRSEPGQGSTFAIYLPEAKESVALAKSSSCFRDIPRGTETVLLVEDEPSVRALAHHVLELNGYRVIEATDGQEAVHIAECHESPIHLVVSDVVMPHLGGRALADRLLALHPHLKILFLSGYTNDAVHRHGVFDTEFPFLEKPFTTSALAMKVRDVLDQPKPAA